MKKSYKINLKNNSVAIYSPSNFNIKEGFIVGYNGSTAGTVTWNDLLKIKVDYDSATGEINASISAYNDNYQSLTYIGKTFTVDPTSPAITKVQ